MKVKLKELKPNPFKKYINGGVLNPQKIDLLKESIKQDGFWDNVICRKNGNGYEIAYGHHRLEAAKQVLGGNHEIDIPVKELTDEMMVRILGNENCMQNEEYAIYQVDQVLLAKKWLEENRRNNIQSSKQSHKDEIGEESKGLDTRQGDYKKDSSQDGENPNTTKLQTLKKARKAIKRKGWARRTAIKLLPLMLCSKRHCLECIYAGKCFVC